MFDFSETDSLTQEFSAPTAKLAVVTVLTLDDLIEIDSAFDALFEIPCRDRSLS